MHRFQIIGESFQSARHRKRHEECVIPLKSLRDMHDHLPEPPTSLYVIIGFAKLGLTSAQAHAPQLHHRYHYRWRYWETVNMLRKTGLIVIVTFVEDPLDAAHIAMWFLAFILLLTQVL